MLKFVILLSAVACALGASIPEGMLPQLDGRIVGGEATTISAYPWQVSLQRDGSHSCGGSIYSANIIVTAAHCLQYVSTSELSVRVGSSYWNSEGSVHQVAAFKNHEGYDAGTMNNDIAIIRLTSSLVFGPNIMEISLATIAPDNGAAATVSGWGTLTSGSSSIPSQLQYVDMKIVSRSECSSSSTLYKYKVKPDMICAAAADKDACQGDSGALWAELSKSPLCGGPLVSGGKQVGIVSWGIGCGNAKYPGVYTDVAVFNSWVATEAANLQTL